MNIFRKLMCNLGYHRIEGIEEKILMGGPEFKENFVYYLICKDCHYHIANIVYKEKIKNEK